MRTKMLLGVGILGAAAILACGSSSNDGNSGSTSTCTGNCPANGFDASAGSDASSANDSSAPVDAGTDAQANDGGTFSPSQLTNLIFWITGATAQTMDAGGFSSWTDLTANHNDFVIQTGTPTLLATSTNGLPGVRFNIENDSVHSPLANYTATTYVISIVTKVDAAAQGDIVAYSGNTSIGGFDLSDMGALDLFFAPSDGTSTTIANAPHVLTVQYAAGNVTLRIDGNASAALTSTAPLGLQTTGGSVRFGGIVQDVSEALMVADPTTSDVTHIERYLKSKYGL